MKTHIRILAWFYIVTCGPLLAIDLTLCVGLAWGGQVDPSQIKALEFIGPPIGFVAAMYLIPGFVSGIGLLRRRRWARAPALIVSTVLMPLPPIGTVVGVYGFWIMLNPETKALFGGSPSPAISVRYPGKPLPPAISLFGAMAAVAGGIFLVLKVGFILHHDPQPSPIDSLAATAAAVIALLAGTVAVTVSILQSGASARLADLRESRPNYSWNDEVRRLRVAELASDPARAKYAPLVERGETWSDRDIAYYEDPAQTTTCAHLRTIERAMRSAGIPAKRFRDRDTVVKCRIDFEALKRDFDVVSTVRYSEFFASEPLDHERPMAFLIYDEDRSMIHTMHPEEAGTRDTPLFPAL